MEGLLSSGGWRAILNARGNTPHQYLFTNTMLISLESKRLGVPFEQMCVGSASWWEKQGRTVKPEHRDRGIRIFAPRNGRVAPPPEPEDDDSDEQEQIEKPRRRGRYYAYNDNTVVFDISQTEGEPYVHEPPAWARGASGEQADMEVMWDTLTDYLESIGYTVEQVSPQDLNGAAGVHNRSQKTIKVDRYMPLSAQVATVAHEAGHAHDPALVKDADSYHSDVHERKDAELVAELTSAMLCDDFGLDNDGAALYMSGWHLKAPDRTGVSFRFARRVADRAFRAHRAIHDGLERRHQELSGSR